MRRIALARGGAVVFALAFAITASAGAAQAPGETIPASRAFLIAGVEVAVIVAAVVVGLTRVERRPRAPRPPARPSEEGPADQRDRKRPAL